jgi:hypothetical protein
VPQRCSASIHNPELMTVRAMCHRDRDHTGLHRSEDETHVITWDWGGENLSIAPKMAEATRPDTPSGSRELQLAFERLREVALKAAHHLRNIPAMSEALDVEMAEELERAAEGE